MDVEVERRHQENLRRLDLLEKGQIQQDRRLEILELEFRTGIAVFKAIGGMGLAVLTAILIKLLIG